MSFEIVHKPTFTNQLLAVPRNRLVQILEKIELLRDDPHPSGNLKKQLHGYTDRVYRLRSGDFRILYTYGEGWVSLLGVDDRKDVYKGKRLSAEPPAVSLTAIPGSPDILSQQPVTPVIDPAATVPLESFAKQLPSPIDDEFLRKLRIPGSYWPQLRSCVTLDDLFDVPMPEELLSRILDVLDEPDYQQVLDQPDLVTGDVGDLLRFAEGELINFLLKLSPEQERFVGWAVVGSGPTMLKGGPGTGKSTIALYRTRAMISALRQSGEDQPRILYTTYTNALVATSEQLLVRLLRGDANLVTVRTADSLAYEIVTQVDGPPRLVDAQRLRELLHEALKVAAFTGTGLARRRNAQTIARFSPDYVLEEIGSMIYARRITSLEAYLQTSRPGRRVGLNASQRTAIWSVYEALERILQRKGLTMWPRLRHRACEIVEGGGTNTRFDGVIIDEVQDLDPTIIHLLVSLCDRPNGILLAADANQSIYGGSFRWADIHEQLRFTGRTGILRTNYRSTREIGTAAAAYACEALIDTDGQEPQYIHSGPLPALRRVTSVDEETALLTAFLDSAAKWLHMHVSAGAVLVPSERAGNAVARRLCDAGIEAEFMVGKALDLERRSVKVLTLQAAKGLEFPFVAVAGLLDSRMPLSKRTDEPDERREMIERERRTLFVAMTRAMRALLVVLPDPTPATLDSGFERTLWNTGDKHV